MSGLVPGRGALRAARALVLTVPAVWLGVAAHALAGGCVTPTGIALTALVLLPTSWAQLSRQRSAAFLLCWLSLSQLLAHGILEIGCTGPDHRAVAPGAAMLGLHIIAVVGTAATSSRADAWVWAVARGLCALRTAVRRVANRLSALDRRSPLPSTRSAARAATAPVCWYRSPWRDDRPVRRGPPVAHRCCA